MTKPSEPPPIAPPSRRTRSFAKTRWLYSEKGRDIGPFSPAEVEELIHSEQLIATTPIREVGQRRMHKVHDIQAFRDALQAVALRKENERKEQEMDRIETAVRSKRRAPLFIVFIGAVVTLAGIGYAGWHLLQTSQTYPASNYTRVLWTDLSVNEIPNRAYVAKRARIEWADESVQWHEKSNRRSRKKSGKKTGPMVSSADDLAPMKAPKTVEEISFLSEGGRELSNAEVNRVMRNMTPRLIRCAQQQANRQARFPGTTVRFSLLKSGKAGRIRIGKNGRRSSAFVQCVKSAIGTVRVEPFSGQGRVISIPLKVGR